MHWAVLRVAAQLKRVAIALEVANDLRRERLEREFPPRVKVGRMVEVSRPTIEDWNKRYYEEHKQEEGQLDNSREQ